MEAEVMILERNDHFPDAKIIQYMHANGYGWRRTTGCNDWFYDGPAGRRATGLKLSFFIICPSI